jgi:uncharacterized protein DUF1566
MKGARSERDREPVRPSRSPRASVLPPGAWAALLVGVVGAGSLACSNGSSPPNGSAEASVPDGSGGDAGGGPGSNDAGQGMGDGGGPDVGRSDDGGGIDDGAPDAGISDGGGSDVATCTNACPNGLTQCGSPGVQTCKLQPNGCTQWVTTQPCAPPETCSLSAGVASCECPATVCTQVGTVCQDPMTVATCASNGDGGGCLYVASTIPCAAPQSCAGAAPACADTCTSTCTMGQTACAPGGIETCTLGADACWGYGAPVACPTRQTCTGMAGAAACACTPDPVCGLSASASACLPTSSTQIVSCAMGPNGCAIASASACPTNLVCERAGTASCVDPNWAEWPMVDTPNYTDNGDGTVTDNGTGLVWQQNASTALLVQADAATYCAGLNLGGYTDWRLPTIVELVSIVDPTEFNSAISSTYFPNTLSSFFWTTTPDASEAGNVWTVTFDIGSVTSAGVIESGYGRCVR